MAPANRKNPQRAKASESQYSLFEFMRDFPDDETCLVWLWNARYATSEPDHAQCPRCGEIRLFKRYGTKQQRQSWTCTACGIHIHPTAGTIFEKSSTSLHLWFYAMYLMASTRCGISAKQLERELGVTYKTAWRMFTKIRNEVMGDDGTPLSGAVEMDEMYVGGKPRQTNMDRWAKLPHSFQRRQAAHEWSRERRTPVFGMVQRGGSVSAHIIPKGLGQRTAIMAHMSAHVEKSPTTTIYTDEAAMYSRLSHDGWNHSTINHSARVYVSGDIHTQTIEGFWGMVKTGIRGVHHHVSAKWLQGYLNEYVWRYNHRDDPQSMFGLLILRAAGV